MDRKTLDRVVPLVYVLAIVIAALLDQSALGPIAIFGALVVTAWFSFFRPAMKARERKQERGDDDRPWFIE